VRTSGPDIWAITATAAPLRRPAAIKVTLAPRRFTMTCSLIFARYLLQDLCCELQLLQVSPCCRLMCRSHSQGLAFDAHLSVSRLVSALASWGFWCCLC